MENNKQMNNNIIKTNNISKIEETFCNPYYLSLIVYIILLFIILYSFDQQNTLITNHIKFFIYCFLFLIFYNIYINDFIYRKIKNEQKLSPTNETFYDIIDKK
tara:strand:+ start:117 stop:425 length:309 start_codon:yes stop_codon:yes gene_type:complete